MGGVLYVALLRAQVKVLRRNAEGKTIMEPNGFGDDGKTLLRPSTKLVTVLRDEPLPDDLADGELERLTGLDALYTRAKARVTIAADEPAPNTDPPELLAAPAATTAAGELDMSLLTGYTDDELVAGLSGSKVPGVKKLLAAVAEVTDPDARKALAGRLLAAEKTAQKGDARTSLVSGLEKLGSEEVSS